MAWVPGNQIIKNEGYPNNMSVNDFTPSVQEDLMRSSVGVNSPGYDKEVDNQKIATLEAENKKYKEFMASDGMLDAIADKYLGQQMRQQAPRQQAPQQQVQQQVQQSQGQQQVQQSQQQVAPNNNFNNIVDGNPSNGSATNSTNDVDDIFSNFFGENKKNENTNQPNANAAPMQQPQQQQQQNNSQQFAVQNPGFNGQNPVSNTNVQENAQSPNTTANLYDEHIRTQLRGVNKSALDKGLNPETVMSVINNITPEQLVDIAASLIHAKQDTPPKTIATTKESVSNNNNNNRSTGLIFNY